MGAERTATSTVKKYLDSSHHAQLMTLMTNNKVSNKSTEGYRMEINDVMTTDATMVEKRQQPQQQQSNHYIRISYDFDQSSFCRSSNITIASKMATATTKAKQR